MRKTKLIEYWKGWLSAMIDGEGSLSLLKEVRPQFKAGCTYKPRLNIGNKHTGIIYTAQMLIGGGCVHKNKKSGVYNLDVSSNLMREVLPQLRFIAKDRQRLLLLKALRILGRKTTKGKPRTDKELEILESIYQMIRKLNGRVWNK